MSPRKSALVLLAGALGVTLAACGGSSGASPASSAPAAAASSSAPATSRASSPPTSAGGSADQTQIATNWATFFSAKTPTATRISLLQDGQEFASVIKSQAGGGLAAEATAKVTKVVVTSPAKANVTYSILIGGTPALAGRTGTAVKQDGTWKVGVASFCGLLALENGGKTSGLPAACTSAG